MRAKDDTRFFRLVSEQILAEFVTNEAGDTGSISALFDRFEAALAKNGLCVKQMQRKAPKNVTRIRRKE